MKGIYNEGDLGNAYSDWLEYKSLGGGREHIRFGQYVYNEYDLEYKNSYNVRSELDAYNLLSEYVYLIGLREDIMCVLASPIEILKGISNESK